VSNFRFSCLFFEESIDLSLLWLKELKQSYFQPQNFEKYLSSEVQALRNDSLEVAIQRENQVIILLYLIDYWHEVDRNI